MGDTHISGLGGTDSLVWCLSQAFSDGHQLVTRLLEPADGIGEDVIPVVKIKYNLRGHLMNDDRLHSGFWKAGKVSGMQIHCKMGTHDELRAGE
jgi:hypothetical protein